MKRASPRALWLVLGLLLGTGGAAAQDAATLARIDAFVAQEVAASGLPGVAIAVLADGRTPHVRGFGHDGRGHAVGLRFDTVEVSWDGGDNAPGSIVTVSASYRFHPVSAMLGPLSIPLRSSASMMISQ